MVSFLEFHPSASWFMQKARIASRDVTVPSLLTRRQCFQPLEDRPAIRDAAVDNEAYDCHPSGVLTITVPSAFILPLITGPSFSHCMSPWGRAESAGINRHRVGDERALHERKNCSIMAPKSCAGGREAAREALTGESIERIGQNTRSSKG